MTAPKTDAIITAAVDKFLCWKLPQNFQPDSFISFDGKKHDTWGGYPNSWPTGTNLLDAGQARTMFEHCLNDALAALQARNQQGPIKTWQERIEETCPAIGPMHIHASVEEVNDAMQAEIDDLRAALQEQARDGEAVAPSAILARGRFHAFKGEDGEPDDWEWFEEGTNCEHGCIDAVIVRADTIAAPQPAQPESIECDCGRIHKKTRYGWACSEPAQPEQGPPT